MSIEWAAGLFEGEGCIRTFKSNKCTYEVKLNMTDLDVLLKLQSICGGTICDFRVTAPHHKQAWIWRISNKAGVKNFLQQCLPYFGYRRTYHAQNLLDHIDAR